MAVRKKFTTEHRPAALGKGLDALISTAPLHTEGSTTINEVPLSQIEPNADQPRRSFSEEALAEMVDSIRTIGVIQPITLHQTARDRYVIIAGERRWRAAQQAGLTTIPAYIRTLSDASLMEMALVENLQREDLNVIEVALAYQHLLEQDGMTQEKIAQRVGKNRSVVTNTLRLLRLPAEVQMALQKRQIDMGHARALLAIDSPSAQVKLFREIVEKGYSVRQVELLTQRMKNGERVKIGKKTITSSLSLPTKYVEAKDALHALLGTKVLIARAKSGRGRITIAFDNDSAFDSIVGKLRQIKN